MKPISQTHRAKIAPNSYSMEYSDMPLHEHVNVQVLWDKLSEMEDRLSFTGKAYPDGMCAFPFRLRGQGFFPGGNGLWRDEGAISEPTSGALPHEGVMFLGNDFGTLQSFQRLRGRAFENPPTWRHLKARVRRANISPDRVFCSNVIVGLRNGSADSALSKKKWRMLEEFPQFCAEFLRFQLTTVRPQLVVTLGPGAAEAMAELNGTTPSRMAGEMTLGDLNTCVLPMSHPYGDFNFDDVRLQRDADVLSEAWFDAMRVKSLREL
jgi:hypothetical protein